MRQVLATLRGAAIETAWIATHVAMYPFGVAAESSRHGLERYTLDGLTPEQRSLVVSAPEAAGTPILLLHGFADNRSIFTVLRRSLRRRGFGEIRTMNYSPFLRDVREAAHLLAAQVERLCAETGYERIHLVGHSLGGVIGRYYVQRLGGDARVHTLVTLGSPHSGTHAARTVPRRVCRQIVPGSRLLGELAEPAPTCRTRIVAFWSDLDQAMLPRHHARVDHPDLRARNVQVRGVGHISLPINRRVVHELASTLAHLTADGEILHRGVTSLGEGRAPAAPRPGERDAGAVPAPTERAAVGRSR